MGIQSFLPLFLIVTFALHGIAFTFLGMKRRKSRYFFLTGTFIFLTSIYFIQWEGWSLRVPGTSISVTGFLRIAATFCTLFYLRSIYGEEGSWFWKLRQRLAAVLSFLSF